MAGTRANAHPGPVLTDLMNQIRKALDGNQVFILTPHTRDHFGSELVHGKSHVDNNVCRHKLTAAVVLNPRNTELQRTQNGAHQVVFEVEFDKCIGQTRFSHNPARHFHLVIMRNTDPNIDFEFVVVTGLVESKWLLEKKMANSTQHQQRHTSLNSTSKEHPISPRCQPHLKTNYENLEKNYGEENYSFESDFITCTGIENGPWTFCKQT